MSDAEPRFAVLETVREFALERLVEHGSADQARRQHAFYFLGEAEEAGAQLRVETATIWLERLATDHDNIRAALRWCIERGEAELALRAVGLLSWFWEVRGHLSEGRAWLRALLDLPASPALRARPLDAAARLAFFQIEYTTARTLQEESLLLRRGMDDRGASRP